ncbi:MAG: GNAT family N-acetyltransferase [Solirubrobacteraceae bacterium]
MIEVRTAHTADLDTTTLDATKRLLVEVFDGDFTDRDWEHACGGMHALAWENAELAGHASLVQRRLLYDAKALRTGYIEGVGVRADLRDRGHGAALMEALERLVRGAYDLGALSSTDSAAGFYEARGWQRWSGPLSVLSPAGIERTVADDGSVYVLPIAVEVDTTLELTCDWRDGDVW